MIKLKTSTIIELYDAEDIFDKKFDIIINLKHGCFPSIISFTKYKRNIEFYI